MEVSGPEEVQPLSGLELMGHLFRRAGFGASRDDLEAEKRFWSAVSVRVDGTGWLYVVEHSRHRIRIYERV